MKQPSADSRRADIGLLARILAAIAEADAEQGLSEAMRVLREYGIAPCAEDQTPWLRVAAAGRELVLALEGRGEPLELRDMLGDALRVAVLRAAEQEEQRRTRERLQMISSASFEGIFVHVEGEIIDTNQSLLEMLRCEREDVVGPGVAPWMVAPEDVPTVLQRIRERTEGAYVITGVRKDGSRFPAELQSKQGRLGERPVRVVAVRDVTERERTSALLRESETRLRELANQAFDFISFTRDGVVLEISEGVERMLGFTPAEVVGRSLADFIAPASAAFVARMQANQRSGAFEVQALSKTGEVVPAAAVIIETSLNGEPIRMGGIRDLREAQRLQDERRKLEEQLQRSQRLESLGVLAGGIAHDFNNLLVGVLGNAELLADSVSKPLDRELCAAIINAAQRANDLTSQLLAYAGQRDLAQRQPIDVSALWRELSAALGTRLSSKAQLELQLSADCVVLGDRVALSQVLTNLLTNASDALEAGSGRIEVTAQCVVDPDARWDDALGASVGPGQWVLLEVRDTGVGMDAATLSRVFEPFFTTKDKGHGLGLASCLGIVTAHGGALRVDSSPGRGTCFAVLLPAATRSLQESSARSRAPGQRGLVLVIDDESVVRSLLRRSLERKGYDVAEAANGGSGLCSIRERKPDLVLLDLSMPDLDGAEVLRRVRASGLDVPVVIASGHLDAASERRLERDSFQGFLHKPFSVAELMEAVESALSGRKPA